MPFSQGDLTKFRWTQIGDTSLRSSGPSDGQALSPDPDFTMGPKTVSQMPTTGLLLLIKEPTDATPATPNAGGFNITVWVRDPGTWQWGAFDTVQIDYDQLFVTYDIDACEIYFEIDNVSVAGAVNIGIAEQ